MNELSPTFRLAQALFDGDANQARACFGETISLDGPYTGKVTSLTGLGWAAGAWPALFRTTRGTKLQLRGETSADGRIVSEILVSATSHDGDPIQLPLAMMGEYGEDARLREARFYFCEKPLTGELRPRLTSFFSMDPPVSTPEDYPDVNARYIGNQIKWNIPGIFEQFGEEPYIERGLNRLEGIEALGEFYKFVIIPDMPVRVVKNTGTYDGRTFILEWSSARIPTASGLAAYERHADGRLKAVRMYDNSPWPCD